MEHQIIYAAGRINKAVSARMGLSDWKRLADLDQPATDSSHGGYDWETLLALPPSCGAVKREVTRHRSSMSERESCRSHIPAENIQIM